MPRTASDIGLPIDETWPPAGKNTCRCTRAVKWLSPKKKTPAVMLYFTSSNEEYNFSDPVFVTGKTIPRLNLVAQRLCGMSSDTQLPDDDIECATFLANYIRSNAFGRQAVITIEKIEETFMHEAGPKMGQKGIKTYSQVAFAGYEEVVENFPVPDAQSQMPEQPAEPLNTPPNEQGPAASDLPF